MGKIETGQGVDYDIGILIAVSQLHPLESPSLLMWLASIRVSLTLMPHVFPSPMVGNEPKPGDFLICSNEGCTVVPGRFAFDYRTLSALRPFPTPPELAEPAYPRLRHPD